MTSHPDPTQRYTIVVRGRLSDRFHSTFDGFAVEPRRGETILSGPVSDQAQLHGVLARLRDLGIELISLNRVETP
jgi:hypothetical protein